VLDAQFFGVAQRRERVFLVVNTRDWRRAAPVLFERESLCWDSASSREKRETLAGGTANIIGNADSHVGECLTPGESQARRVYAADGVMPTLQAREHGGQNQQAVMLDFHQQDGRFKVSNHPEVSNTLTSHMGTGGNNVPLVKAFNPTLSTDHNPAVYEVAGNIIGRGAMNGGNQLGVADPDENGAFTLTSTDRHAVVEIERERSDVQCGQSGERGTVL
jgi:DNA (cytosine-5)-methyltransferase 1